MEPSAHLSGSLTDRFVSLTACAELRTCKGLASDGVSLAESLEVKLIGLRERSAARSGNPVDE